MMLETLCITVAIILLVLLIRACGVRVIYGKLFLPEMCIISDVYPKIRIGFFERCTECGTKNSFESVALSIRPEVDTGQHICQLDPIGVRCTSCNQLYSTVTRWQEGNMAPDIVD